VGRLGLAGVPRQPPVTKAVAPGTLDHRRLARAQTNRDRAVMVAAQNTDTGLLIPLQHPCRRMPESVSIADLKDRPTRRHRREEGRR
jgi:hypothetical protein